MNSSGNKIFTGILTSGQLWKLFISFFHISLGKHQSLIWAKQEESMGCQSWLHRNAGGCGAWPISWGWVHATLS